MMFFGRSPINVLYNFYWELQLNAVCFVSDSITDGSTSLFTGDDSYTKPLAK